VVLTRDRFRKYIEWCREAYVLAADPPAINYARRVEPSYRDDANAYTRIRLLQTSLDMMRVIDLTLRRLPKQRADALIGWMLDGSNYYKYSLSHVRRKCLMADISALKRNYSAWTA